MARESGLGGLTPRHWRVLLCCREAAAREGSAPDLCCRLRPSRSASLELERLFRRPSSAPSGPFDSSEPFEPFHSFRVMTQIAGLPKPPEWIDVP